MRHAVYSCYFCEITFFFYTLQIILYKIWIGVHQYWLIDKSDISTTESALALYT